MGKAAVRLKEKLWAVLHGPPDVVTGHVFTRWLFFRGLGSVLFIAFYSLLGQLEGLIGTRGILPAEQFLERARIVLGTEALWQLPTLGWWDASDLALRGYCWAGMGVSLLVVLGVLTPVSLAVGWVLYLSLYHLGQDFLGFQWDILLLETSFAALLLAPWTLLEKPRCAPAAMRPESRRRCLDVMLEDHGALLAQWAIRFVLFKLMFMSGWVKLDDPTWTELRALDYHYLTQPLPTAAAWYAHQLPHVVQAASVFVMFVIELVLPFALFCPRRVRHAGAMAQILFQVALIITGNYTYFNHLTMVLAVLWFDDGFWRAMGLRLRRAAIVPVPAAPPPRRWPALTALVLRATAAGILVLLSCAHLWSLARPYGEMPAFARVVLGATRPFAISSGYGLFRFMTTERNEIILEGSNDGAQWRMYDFRYKPDALDERPRRIAPLQPRLDWQMWFAALGRPQQYPWFSRLLEQVLLGSPPVLELFAGNPFPEKPPKYVRAKFYAYRFTTFAERAATGNWWAREDRGLYFPQVSLSR
jgi:hypothetical protein